MADLELSVAAPGADTAAAGLDRVGAATTRTGQSWDQLKRKLGSGEVLRNAAASAALLASGAGNTTQKVAALGGALASIPGPVGLVASAVAVGATVLGVFTANAEAAEKAAAELAATLADLGKEKGAAQLALAGRVTDAALGSGGALRRFNASGGTAEGLQAAAGLRPGDTNGALNLASQLATSGLSGEQQSQAQETLADVKAAGQELSDAVVARVIAGIKDDAEAFAGGPAVTGTREGRANRLGRFLDAVGADSTNRGRLSSQGNAAFQSQGGQVNTSLIQAAEAPAVARSLATTRDALGAGRAAEALALATQKNAGATEDLTKTITELTTKLNTLQGGGGIAPQRDSAWVDTGLGRGPVSPRP